MSSWPIGVLRPTEGHRLEEKAFIANHTVHSYIHVLHAAMSCLL